MKVIERIARDRGLSFAKIARMADIPESCMCRIRAGREPLYPRRGARLAAALDYDGDPESLFREESEVSDDA